MSELRLELDGGRLAYAPGEEIRGTASWSLEKDPRTVEVRLFWRTQGKGEPDGEVATSRSFDAPGRQDRRPFRLLVPPAPYSYAGKVLSIVWSVELVVEPGSEAERRDVVVSPSGRAVDGGVRS